MNDRMRNIFDTLSAQGGHRVMALCDHESGLYAFMSIDSLVLGPAFGGIRTLPYSCIDDAICDVVGLSQAMTRKCSIAGLNAGGGKTVVIDHEGLDRAKAFKKLGWYINELQGLYRTAGDLGTRYEDLLCASTETEFVNIDGEQLGVMTAETVVNGIFGYVDACGGGDVSSLTVAVQGCGLIGGAVARRLANLGTRVIVSDIDEKRAAALALDTGGLAVDPDKVLLCEADIVAPCAIGGVITRDVAEQMSAKAICGGANNQLSDETVADTLHRRNIVFVPDFLASSGAVISGACKALGDNQPDSLLAQTRRTTREVLERARREDRSPMVIAQDMALDRIRRAAGQGRGASSPDSPTPASAGMEARQSTP